jgi:pilin isopeptide linkage protein
MPAETSITIKKSDADQTKSFGEVEFTKPGTYKYVVKETKGNIAGITYDDVEHPVTIKVVDDGNGNLVAEEGSQLIQTTKSTNTYGASGEGEIKVQTVLNGREWTDNDQITSTVSAADGTPMPSETSITIKKSDTDQTKSFGKIAFTKEGTYTYTVKAEGNDKGEVEITFTIEVSDPHTFNGSTEKPAKADCTPVVDDETGHTYYVYKCEVCEHWIVAYFE